MWRRNFVRKCPLRTARRVTMHKCNGVSTSSHVDFKSTALVLSLVLVIFWSAGPVLPSAQPTLPPAFGNKKIILYEKESGDGGYWTTGVGSEAKPLSLDRKAQKRRVLEEYAEFLSPLRLPSTLGLFASDCDGSDWATPYYD